MSGSSNSTDQNSGTCPDSEPYLRLHLPPRLSMLVDLTTEQQEPLLHAVNEFFDRQSALTEEDSDQLRATFKGLFKYPDRLLYDFLKKFHSQLDVFQDKGFTFIKDMRDFIQHHSGLDCDQIKKLSALFDWLLNWLYYSFVVFDGQVRMAPPYLGLYQQGLYRLGNCADVSLGPLEGTQTHSPSYWWATFPFLNPTLAVANLTTPLTIPFTTYGAFLPPGTSPSGAWWRRRGI